MTFSISYTTTYLANMCFEKKKLINTVIPYELVVIFNKAKERVEVTRTDQ